MRGLVPLLAALVLAAACGTEPAALERATAVIVTSEGEARLDVELAETPEQRRQGLMGRESLPENAGMAFVYTEDVRTGFWMKDTLIPLSIAFAGADGRILRILDMEPCLADPCPNYEPGVAYRLALEVNKGAFERLGVAADDALRIER